MHGESLLAIEDLQLTGPSSQSQASGAPVFRLLVCYTIFKIISALYMYSAYNRGVLINARNKMTPALRMLEHL